MVDNIVNAIIRSTYDLFKNELKIPLVLKEFNDNSELDNENTIICTIKLSGAANGIVGFRVSKKLVYLVCLNNQNAKNDILQFDRVCQKTFVEIVCAISRKFGDQLRLYGVESTAPKIPHDNTCFLDNEKILTIPFETTYGILSIHFAIQK